MPRAIFDNDDEMIAILNLIQDTDPILINMEYYFKVPLEGRGCYWRFITSSQFETYREFGIRELELQQCRPWWYGYGD